MPTRATFRELMERLLRHDPDAAAELVEQYGDAIHREVRMMFLTRSHLRRMFDSGDIVQSVLANFFLRIDLGELDLRKPEQLLGLLREMARNRVRDKVRYRRARCRDDAREHPDVKGLAEEAVDEETPSRIVEYEEMLQQARNLLTPRERLIADRRSEHVAWEAIARELNERPEALRKQFSRTMDRIMKGLGLAKRDEG